MDKWDKRFLDLAELVSTWSKDTSTKVGAVIVNNQHRVISVGFNGYPVGIPDDDLQNRKMKYAKIIHAEVNALAFAYQDVAGCTLYCTHCPCSQCASMIIQRGITCIVFKTSSDGFTERWQTSNKLALDMFKKANIKIKL